MRIAPRFTKPKRIHKILPKCCLFTKSRCIERLKKNTFNTFNVINNSANILAYSYLLYHIQHPVCKGCICIQENCINSTILLIAAILYSIALHNSFIWLWNLFPTFIPHYISSPGNTNQQIHRTSLHRHSRWWAQPGTAWDCANKTESYCLRWWMIMGVSSRLGFNVGGMIAIEKAPWDFMYQ